MRSFFTISGKQSERGFTIVEVLVALTIFSIAVAGVITAAVQGGINVTAAQNKMTASYLAQEGIELMRAKRDSYVVAAASYGAGWSSFVNATMTSCNFSGPCDIDVSDTTSTIPGSTGSALGLGYVPCSGSCVLNYSSSGFYSHASSSTASQFTRRLTVVPLPSSTAPTEMEVTSTVTWGQGSTTQSIAMSESIFNWYGTSP